MEGYTGAHYWFARGSLGNLPKHKQVFGYHLDINTKDKFAISFDFKCTKNGKLTDLVHFGLGKDSEIIQGPDAPIDVKMVDKCSMGTMLDLRQEWSLD